MAIIELRNLEQDRKVIPVGKRTIHLGSVLDTGVVGVQQPRADITGEEADFIRKHPVTKGMIEANTIGVYG